MRYLLSKTTKSVFLRRRVSAFAFIALLLILPSHHASAEEQQCELQKSIESMLCLKGRKYDAARASIIGSWAKRLDEFEIQREKLRPVYRAIADGIHASITMYFEYQAVYSSFVNAIRALAESPSYAAETKFDYLCIQHLYLSDDRFNDKLNDVNQKDHAAVIRMREYAVVYNAATLSCMREMLVTGIRECRRDLRLVSFLAEYPLIDSACAFSILSAQTDSATCSLIDDFVHSTNALSSSIFLRSQITGIANEPKLDLYPFCNAFAESEASKAEIRRVILDPYSDEFARITSWIEANPELAEEYRMNHEARKILFPLSHEIADDPSELRAIDNVFGISDNLNNSDESNDIPKNWKLARLCAVLLLVSLGLMWLVSKLQNKEVI